MCVALRGSSGVRAVVASGHPTQRRHEATAKGADPVCVDGPTHASSSVAVAVQFTARPGRAAAIV